MGGASLDVRPPGCFSRWVALVWAASPPSLRPQMLGVGKPTSLLSSPPLALSHPRLRMTRRSTSGHRSPSVAAG